MNNYSIYWVPFKHAKRIIKTWPKWKQKINCNPVKAIPVSLTEKLQQDACYLRSMEINVSAKLMDDAAEEIKRLQKEEHANLILQINHLEAKYINDFQEIKKQNRILKISNQGAAAAIQDLENIINELTDEIHRLKIERSKGWDKIQRLEKQNKTWPEQIVSAGRLITINILRAKLKKVEQERDKLKEELVYTQQDLVAKDSAWWVEGRHVAKLEAEIHGLKMERDRLFKRCEKRENEWLQEHLYERNSLIEERDMAVNEVNSLNARLRLMTANIKSLENLTAELKLLLKAD